MSSLNQEEQLSQDSIYALINQKIPEFKRDSMKVIFIYFILSFNYSQNINEII